MNNRFTAKAQNTLNNALRFAHEMGHTYIGSEHILLALASETDSVAAKLLAAKGVATDKLREQIASLSGLGTASNVSAADMTPRTKRRVEAETANSRTKAEADAQVSTTRAAADAENSRTQAVADADTARVKAEADQMLILLELRPRLMRVLV